jgi:hypothetical protein
MPSVRSRFGWLSRSFPGSNPAALVLAASGGKVNAASGDIANVLGGTKNTAGGIATVVIGGQSVTDNGNDLIAPLPLP